MGIVLKAFAVILMIFISVMIQRFTTQNDDLSHLEELPHKLQGNKESNDLIVFLHGWPNKMSMWEGIIKKLEADFYCLRITYPGFSSELDIKVGTDFNTIIDLVALTIKKIQNSSNKKYKVTIVGHDYGAFFTYLLDARNPELVDKMVTIDVAHIFSKTLTSAIFNTSYQSFLATSNAIGGPIGRFMTSMFGNVYAALDKSTLVDETDFDFDPKLTYLYVEIFKSISEIFKFADEYVPKKPFTFIYGKNKPTTFHEQQALDQINAVPGNEIISVETGHWVTITHEDLCVEAIKRRVLGK